MVKNSWNNVTLVCGNHGSDHTNIMAIKEYLGNSLDSAFYSCPEYRSIYAKEQDGKRSCNNRLSVGDFEKMLMHLYEMSLDENGPEDVNLTGYKWKTRNGISYEVLEHTVDGKFTVKVLNHKVRT